MKLSDLEKIDLEKMNKNDFTMDEWQDFTVCSILAHLVQATYAAEVKICLDRLTETEE